MDLERFQDMEPSEKEELIMTTKDFMRMETERLYAERVANITKKLFNGRISRTQAEEQLREALEDREQTLNCVLDFNIQDVIYPEGN